MGMNKRKLFFMILIETLMLGLVAGPIGIVLGDPSVRAMMEVGLDLSTKKDGLAGWYAEYNLSRDCTGILCNHRCNGHHDRTYCSIVPGL